MVFEHLMKLKEIKYHYLNIFIMGFIFSEIGILASFLAFSSSVDLMSVGFIAAISIPFLLHIIDLHVHVSSKKSFFANLFETNRHIFESYIFLFLGVFFSYVIYSLMLPEASVFYYFKEQLSFFNLTGNATRVDFSFAGIITNNFKVLLVFFILSVIFGVGSVLFLVWNASVWGILLGYYIKLISVGDTLFLKLVNTMLRFLPHMILEASSYLFSIISGVIVSQTIVSKTISKKQKKEIILQGVFLFFISLVLLLISAYIEVYIYPLL